MKSLDLRNNNLKQKKSVQIFKIRCSNFKLVFKLFLVSVQIKNFEVFLFKKCSK